MIKKAILVLAFLALVAVTLSQVNSVDAGNQIKPTSPKVKPSPKPTSPKDHGHGKDATYSGVLRIFDTN